MVSFEKCMFFLPNRFFVQGKEAYVSFNIASIPSDMIVTSMNLQIPLPAHQTDLAILVQEITTGWDESLMAGGYQPQHPLLINQLVSPAGEPEITVHLQHLQEKWRHDSLQNHGVYIQLLSLEPCCFTEEQPPYLLVSTV
ncbi:hypothetical protein [Brevibacillus fulvus]|uniref:Uncharacterized protein n=1 Tax=Brevibacillus fulvus TaxID=1125967 RepID=A0A938XY28_9BACL|nr:hypothetical protein [Brevibacillus fulvus]MBM7589034.1 hypothetical protein [Brevibacillus fulvus]